MADEEESGGSRRWAGESRRSRTFAVALVTFYIGSLLLIYVGSPNQPIDVFPTECPENSHNCTRLAPNPYRGDNLSELRFNASKEEVFAAALAWIESEPRTLVLTESEQVGYIHSVFRSFMFRFPDDLLVHVHCDNGQSGVWVHSQSRIGAYDLEVNNERVAALRQHLESQQWESSNCTV